MAALRDIPSIDVLRQRGGVRAMEAEFGGDATVDALRVAVAALRRGLAAGTASVLETSGPEELAGRIEAAARVELERMFHASLERVINATGVIIHTNLGR